MPDPVSSSTPVPTRILLGGGGSAEDERPVFERFATWVDAGRVLYLPLAADQPGAAHLAWVTSAIAPLGVRQIDMWTTLAGRQPAELGGYAGIFIGGGNTYWLLHQLRAGGFDDAIRRFALGGGVLYGGSAGAIVLGANIATCAHIDHNDVGITDLHGLDLLDGSAAWCHYQAADYPLCQAFIMRTRISTFLLAETSGLWRRGPEDYVALGTPPARLITHAMVA